MNINSRVHKYKVLINKITGISNGMYVMCYHEVANIANIKNLAIRKITTDLNQFKEHINYYINNFNIIDYKEAYNIIKSKKENTDKYLLLTFDDNYIGSLNNAIPFLNKHNITPIVFCNNSTFFHNKILWRVWLGEVYINNKRHINGYSFNEIMKITKSSHNYVMENLWDMYLNYQPNNKYHFTYEDYNNSDLRFLVASHTCNHFMLSNLPYNKLIEEMINSISEFKLYINNGYSTKFFAYPYGYNGTFSDNAISLLSVYYNDIIAFNDYNTSNGTEDPYNYPRINIGNETLGELVEKLKMFKL